MTDEDSEYKETPPVRLFSSGAFQLTIGGALVPAGPWRTNRQREGGEAQQIVFGPLHRLNSPLALVGDPPC